LAITLHETITLRSHSSPKAQPKKNKMGEKAKAADTGKARYIKNESNRKK